jgi:hypothetical protein
MRTRQRETLNIMWLPEPIYEGLPYMYLAIGASLLGGAIYIGVGVQGMPFYVGLGFITIVVAAAIYVRRSTARKYKAGSEPTENP